MSFVSMPRIIENETYAYLRRGLSCSNKSNFYNDQIVPRIVDLVMPVFIAAVAAIETVIGVSLFIEVILTRATNKTLNENAAKRLRYPSLVIADIFKRVLRLINLEADFGLVAHQPKQGLIYALMVPVLNAKSKDFYSSNNFFEREIVTRLCVTLTAVAAVIARVIDTIFGVMVAAAAVCTLGTIEKVNSMAHHELRFPGILIDGTDLVRNIINPGSIYV